ncbi:hypothetical protein EON77_12550, partial [bacterium]
GPNTYGLHTQKSNVAWVDGHAKSQSVTVRPLAAIGNDEAKRAFAEKNRVGDIMNPQYGYGSDWQDFYYRVDKP